jgi:hypothetical protein
MSIKAGCRQASSTGSTVVHTGEMKQCSVLSGKQHRQQLHSGEMKQCSVLSGKQHRQQLHSGEMKQRSVLSGTLIKAGCR